jgi:hypothetical protein
MARSRAMLRSSVDLSFTAGQMKRVRELSPACGAYRRTSDRDQPLEFRDSYIRGFVLEFGDAVQYAMSKRGPIVGWHRKVVGVADCQRCSSLDSYHTGGVI